MDTKSTLHSLIPQRTSLSPGHYPVGLGPRFCCLNAALRPPSSTTLKKASASFAYQLAAAGGFFFLNRSWINAYHAGVNGGLLDVSGDAGDEGIPVLKVGVEVGLWEDCKAKTQCAAM